jgi:hypothetical protein
VKAIKPIHFKINDYLGTLKIMFCHDALKKMMMKKTAIPP